VKDEQGICDNAVREGDADRPYEHFKVLGMSIGLGRIVEIHDALISELKTKQKDEPNSTNA
jgi:hypothetical protein